MTDRKQRFNKTRKCVDCGCAVPYLVKRCPEHHKAFLASHPKRGPRPDDVRFRISMTMMGRAKKLKAGATQELVNHKISSAWTPEKRIEASNRLRAFWASERQMRGQFYRPKMPQDIRRFVNQRDAGHCQWCDQPGEHIHHRDENPFNNDPENLVTLCLECHGREHRRLTILKKRALIQASQGLSVPSPYPQQ